MRPRCPSYAIGTHQTGMSLAKAEPLAPDRPRWTQDWWTSLSLRIAPPPLLSRRPDDDVKEQQYLIFVDLIKHFTFLGWMLMKFYVFFGHTSNHTGAIWSLASTKVPEVHWWRLANLALQKFHVPDIYYASVRSKVSPHSSQPNMKRWNFS